MEHSKLDDVIRSLGRAKRSAVQISKLSVGAIAMLSDRDLAYIIDVAGRIIPDFIPDWIRDDLGDIVRESCHEIFAEDGRRKHKKYVAEMTAQYGENWEKVLEDIEAAQRDARMSEVHGHDWKEKLAKLHTMAEIVDFNCKVAIHEMNKRPPLWASMTRDDCKKEADEVITGLKDAEGKYATNKIHN